MAKLMLIGDVAQVELTIDPEDAQVVATCTEHRAYPNLESRMVSCDWTERYDDLRDASEYAADHADRGATS